MQTPARRRRLDGAVDLGVALLAFAGGALRDLHRHQTGERAGHIPVREYLLEPAWPWILLVHLVAASALLGRRRHPMVVAGVLGLAACAVPTHAAVYATYATVRYGRSVRAALAINCAVLAGLVTGGRLWPLTTSPDWRQGDPHSLALVIALVTVLGLYGRTRADLVTEVSERARMSERVDLALRLHDDLARDLTLATLSAGALSVQSSEPEIRRDAEAIRRHGERALHQLHTLIAALTGPPRAPGPGTDLAHPVGIEPIVADSPVERAVLRALDRAHAASEGTAAALAQVSIVESGDPSRSDPRWEAALRAVTEQSLRNVASHAPGARVRVRARYRSDGGLELWIEDVPRPATAPVGTGGQPPTIVARNGPATQDAVPGLGAGLDAAARQCEVLGGRLEHGPAGVGYLVHAQLWEQAA